MLNDRDYHVLSRLNKREQRLLLIRLLYGSHAALARDLGVTRGAVHHIAALRGTSARIEDRVKADLKRYGRKFGELWAA